MSPSTTKRTKASISIKKAAPLDENSGESSDNSSDESSDDSSDDSSDESLHDSSDDDASIEDPSDKLPKDELQVETHSRRRLKRKSSSKKVVESNTKDKKAKLMQNGSRLTDEISKGEENEEDHINDGAGENSEEEMDDSAIDGDGSNEDLILKEQLRTCFALLRK